MSTDTDLGSSLAMYLNTLQVDVLPGLTCPFDPGYDAGTVEAHLAQSGHLMAGLKISMACWRIAAVDQSARKVAAARKAGVPVTTGGGPFEIAVARGLLGRFLDLVATLGVDRIEAGEGFTELALPPSYVVREAKARSLQVQFELGKKHEGTFGPHRVPALIDQGQRWLDAGAMALVIEGRECASSVGIFGADGELDRFAADRFAGAFGLSTVYFEAPDKRSQFALLDHFGRDVRMSNVRLEELLRVEIYRRGLHSDAFDKPGLAPAEFVVKPALSAL